MTDTVSILAEAFEDHQRGAAAPGTSLFEFMAKRLAAASPQGEGDCVCVRRGDGPEGCGLCNETGVVTSPASPQGEGSSADADTHRAAEGAVLADMTSALNPFAAMIGHIDDWMDDDYCPSWSPFIPVAAYRKAHAAMIAYRVTEGVKP